jgi:AcrR family transcriptional regulator
MSKGAQTRQTILGVAFELTYAHGFQSTSIDEILKKTHVTKGSFFHHFKNKEEMGLAMIEEIMYPGMYRSMIEPLLNGDQPIEEIYAMMEGLLNNDQFFNVKYGCPAINLIDEMAPLNESFNMALSKLSVNWQKAIEDSLRKAKSTGQISSGTDCKRVALFIMSGYGGIRNLGKLYGRACYSAYLTELKTYLSQL